MPIPPKLSKTFIHDLKGINPCLNAKWESRLKRWEIWFDSKGCGKHYIILTSKDHIDSRTLSDIRRAFWWSQHPRVNSIEMQNEAEYAKIKRDEQHYDDFVEIGKEVAPLLKTLADAGTSSYGKSKTMFEGVGESKVFGGDEGIV